MALVKTLVIADLHNKVHWVEECIEAEKPDLVVFLGDYFDSFDETLESTIQTAEWLKQSLDKPKRVHLMGNHDMPYRYPSNSHLYCPGFTHEKSHLINDLLDHQSSWEKLKSFHFIDGWLLSHAGIHQKLLHPILGFDLEQLRRDEEEAFLRCASGIGTPMFGCGRSRGGSYLCGGITWQDFDIDFVPMQEVNQIVGHTPHPQVCVKLLIDEEFVKCTWDEFLSLDQYRGAKSVNFGLDTHRKYYAVIEDGVVRAIKNQFVNKLDLSQ
ncbi:MAG: metallophosphoesterase [Simkaniaceae bacterium]|nr:metallophosphoesterase [Candidatus Sacchlamyda saccharinae]